MNIAYTVFTDNEFMALAEIMMESLLENTSCDEIRAGIVTEKKSVLERFQSMHVRIHPFRIDKWQWDRNRMAYKIELIGNLHLTKEDKVFILDSDLYVKKDIFEWFDNETDVIMTVRPEFFLSANGGVWGFQGSRQGLQFLLFFIEQMQNPAWEPFKKYRIINAHDQEGRDWWMDQDFLCAVNDNGLDFPCNIKKLHCRTHNCTPSKKGMIECLDNPDKSIVHFKGGLKPIWLDYYPEFKRRKDADKK